MPGARIDKRKVIQCELSPTFRKRIKDYSEALVRIAPDIGDHGLTEIEFWRSGLFRSAVESLRGTQAASMAEKKGFISAVLTRLEKSGRIKSFDFTGAGDRHDYQIMLANNRHAVIESKGCLDGNNTTVYTRPPNADEFVIWSLCQNPGADPKHNIWSGLHTRLGGKIISEKERVDALIVWDMLCGGIGRICPKTRTGKGLVMEGVESSPPCIYLFPRTIPDPRNNPCPDVWKLHEVGLAHTLFLEFGGTAKDVIDVQFEVRMNGANVERKTRLMRKGSILVESDWTELKRASR